MHRNRHPALKQLISALLFGLACHAPVPARVMIQYFESKWETIEYRMPDVFMSGYGAIYVPPPTRADSGDQSVGYDVFDRFDLGYEGRPTLYGTESSFDLMVDQARRAGVFTYIDTIFNHNGFSDGFRGDPSAGACALNWAINEGGYPGFVISGRDLTFNPAITDKFNLEFRNVCPSAQFPAPDCNTDPVNCRLAGLLDINPDRTTLFWIRHPAVAGNPANIPYQTPKPSNRRLYPDVDLASPYDDGVRPFNLADPMLGDPYTENVNGMLQRWTQWMLEVHRVDGFRLDAIKHTNTTWFRDVYDVAANDRARDFWGRQATAYSFGENPTGNNADLAPYHRKDGFGNRTVLDFPLKYAMNNNIGNSGAGISFANILNTTFDSQDDGDAQNGSAGVMLVQNHDNGLGDPPQIDNVAYAHILTRKGYPSVYYNAQEFGTGRDFPNRNRRGDALGLFGNTMQKLLQVHRNFVGDRGNNAFRSLWADADVVAYELNNTLVVGLSDWVGRGPANLGYIEVSVSNFGFRNVTLTEVTGNAADPLIDPNNAIPDTLTIPATGSVALRIPTTQNANSVTHNKPYVMYSILPPQGNLSLVNKSTTIGADGTGVAEAARRLTPIDVVTSNTAVIELKITPGGAPEDNAVLKWNYGINVDGDNTGANGIANGIDDPLFAGFDSFRTIFSPTIGGGTGTYRQNVDLTNPLIKEGYQYITAMAFVQRLSGLPIINNSFRKVIYVDRQPPDIKVSFPPTQTGIRDVSAGGYEFVIDNPDATGNSLHYFWNLPVGTDPIPLLNNNNKASKTDRSRFRFLLNNLQAGNNQRLTLVMFELTGNRRIQTFLIGVAARNSIGADQWANY